MIQLCLVLIKRRKLWRKKSLKHGNVGLKALFCKIINKTGEESYLIVKVAFLYNFWHQNAMIIFTFE